MSKSLAELTGIDWGDAPAAAGSLARERHELRRIPIRDLPDDAVVRFLDVGSDADILVPVSLERLLHDPEAVGLLCAVLRADHYNWRGRSADVATLREQVGKVINQVSQITDELERLRYEAAIWRFYAEFERGLSGVE